jgi:hypothetical protein
VLAVVEVLAAGTLGALSGSPVDLGVKGRLRSVREQGFRGGRFVRRMRRAR